MRKFISIYLFLIASFMISPCNVFSQDNGYFRNWDTVEKALDYYKKNSFDEVVADFGDNYTSIDDSCIYYSPSGESSIIFSVKKNKVKGVAYKGSYADILSYLDTIPKLKVSEIVMAAECWIGFPVDLLKETYGDLIYSSTEKFIRVGPSDESFIEFTTSIPASGQSGVPSSSGVKKIRKVKISGTYDELKDYVLCVPKDSVSIK
ncbi:hypothetical protein [uncultured Treponema sp.]|uniref:hypothetical protein n=1 Tax=uncultured Treponema sp. TaxID=162155 RepID=UPI000E960B79|nr:hypothetical protein [uncultured Treponema sp.]HAZ97165.1 hypothetical protein [Treponema sp.]